MLFEKKKKKKAVKHTTTSVQDPLQIKFSLQFDKWQIKPAEIIETTVKNTNFEERDHFRNLFFFNALCFPFIPQATGTRQPAAVFTLEVIIRLWVYGCVCTPYDPSIAHLFDLANTLLQSFARQYRKTRLLGNFFGNKEQCRLYFQFNTPVQYHLKVRHRISSRSCLAALFSAGDRLIAPEKGYTGQSE